jgi:alpha/beta superfamily hydrolase
MIAKEISIPIANYSVIADWYENTKATVTVLVFVGFGSHKSRQGELVKAIAGRAGVSALVVNLSGQGEGLFRMDEIVPAQHVMEAVFIYDWMKANYPKQTIYCMGTSYGGFVAAYLTRFREIDTLVLRTPAIYKPEDLYTRHQYIDKRVVREYRKNTELLLHHPLFLQPPLGNPKTLVVAHSNDESVPAETTSVYSDNFHATTYVAEGFVHAFRDSSNPKDAVDAYVRTVADWLTQLDFQ